MPEQREYFVVLSANNDHTDGAERIKVWPEAMAGEKAMGRNGQKTVLCLSSQVVAGHVGLSAGRPVLERMGHVVLAMPTVLLARHPGLMQPPIVQRIDPATLIAMIDALARQGVTAEVDAVLTGYLPSVEHVKAAAHAIATVRRERPDVLVMVDPILGDFPGGLYLDPSAAEAIREDLVPLADIIKPNAFELGWLTGRPTMTGVTTAAEVEDAAADLSVRWVVASSIRTAGRLATIAVPGARGPSVDMVMTDVSERPAHTVPKGTGDALSACMIGHLLHGRSLAMALQAAVHFVDAVLDVSNPTDLAVQALDPMRQN